MNEPADRFDEEGPADRVRRARFCRTAISRAIMGSLVASCVMSAAVADSKPEGQIGATGFIAPRSGIILMRTPPDAVIRTIYVHLGDHVKKGDPLVALDDDAIKAELNIAMLEYDAATRSAAQRTGIESLTLSLAEAKLQRAQK